MSRLPEPEDREWLLASLADLLSRTRRGPFLDAPLIEATDQWFPDPWTGDPEGVGAICVRLLDYAGLEQLRVRVEVAPERPRWGGVVGAMAEHREGPPAWFAGIEEGICHIGCTRDDLGEPEVLVAHLGHEVAHAWRRSHGLEVPDRDVEERLTDLSTVYLGFGLFTVNASWRDRSWSDGSVQWTRRSESGYLSAPQMSFLLAAQAVARELGWWDRRWIARRLEANQAGFFRAAVRHLIRPRGCLRWRLGLPSDYAPPEVDLDQLLG